MSIFTKLSGIQKNDTYVVFRHAEGTGMLLLSRGRLERNE